MYKPKVVDSGNFGTWMRAKVAFSPDGKKAKVTPINKDGEVEEAFVVSKNDLPDLLTSKGDYLLQVDKDKKVVTFRPTEGMFVGKFVKFASSKDAPPQPKTIAKTFVKDGKTVSYEYLSFTALISIEKGTFKGLEIPLNLRYNFTEVEEDGKQVLGLKSSTSKYTVMLIEFLDAVGAWDNGALPYKDNVLPLLEKRIVKADKTFKFVMKDSWITTFFSSDVDNSDE